MQTFAEFSISQLDKIPKENAYAIMQSERDGPLRDSISVAVILQLQKRNMMTSRCILKSSCKWDDLVWTDNSCGAPHSAFSHAENIDKSPNALYWEESMFYSIERFFADDRWVVGTLDRDADKTQCQSIFDYIGGGPMFYDAGKHYVKQAIERYIGQ